jgi:hypothetical protein
MQEFILTLVVIFVLFKVFGRAHVINFNQHNHHQDNGKVKITPRNSKNKPSNDEGEYVDYEEIK